MGRHHLNYKCDKRLWKTARVQKRPTQQTNAVPQTQQVEQHSTSQATNFLQPGTSRQASNSDAPRTSASSSTAQPYPPSIHQPLRVTRRRTQPGPATRTSQRIASRVVQQQQQQQEVIAEPPNRNVNFITTTTLNRRRTLRLPATYNEARLRENDNNITDHDVGTMTNKCKHCHAKLFDSELSDGTSRICCHKGHIQLEPLQPSPVLQSLIENNDNRSKEYLEHIRQYNNALAFASIKAQAVQIPGRGPFCFKIHGQIYHSAGSLEPPEGSVPAYASLFVVDSAEALEMRMAHGANADCSEVTMRTLQNMLQQVNPYAQLFLSMKDIRAQTPDLTLHFTLENAFDRRRYNLPTTSDEIAAVFTTTDGAPSGKFDFVMYNKSTGSLCTISYLNPHCDPMCYPLLFPHGHSGWRPGMRHEEIRQTAVRNTTTQLQYYCYRLAVREGFNLLHASGKLFQQYIVDSYVKVEGSRIAFIKSHQKEIRAESYKGLVDFIHSDAQRRGLLAGVPVILPSTFLGSPRNMLQNYQDAMAIVARLGKPDLFLTFTANPKWPEITSNLQPYETAHGRPDLVTRVFYSKLQHLLHELHNDHILGVVTAHVHVIEFQKRGLPHVHMLLILKEADKIREIHDADSVVCAEIPDIRENERLHNIVKQCMIHGPCGQLNPNAPCMNNGQCTKGFPKEFEQDTKMNVNGYPLYRRRNNGRVIWVGNKLVDNRWVVPYNPYLSLKYQAHINLEICSSVKSVKYLYKYIYKGHDCASLRIRNRQGEGHLTVDELDLFLDCRYISPPEAMWRLHERPLFDKSHTIERLPIHLEEEQTIYFQVGQEDNAALGKDTKLSAFFKLCATDAAAMQYLYPEIPEHYVWDKKDTQWKPRKRFTRCFGRMYTVNPADSERFHLRILLLHVKGPTSFQDIKTVEGCTYPTFRSTAIKLKLIDDDLEWMRCLQEATAYQMPFQLRQLFAMICVFCSPMNPVHLWQMYRSFLSEDFCRTHEEEASYDMALSHIDSILKEHRKTCSDFVLPCPTVAWEDYTTTVLNLNEEKDKAEQMYRKLNQEQKLIADEVIQAVQVNRQDCYFVDGPGGTGKTFLYNTLIQMLKCEQKSVLSVAWTGIAATLLPGGRTAHSLFKLPVPLLETSSSSIRSNSKEADEIRKSSLIIWDEISMVPGQALIIVDKLLRDLTQINALFGGKILLFGGDFRQVLPVVRHGNRVSIVEATVKRVPLWSKITQRKLTENMRASEDREFSDWLLRLGDGTLPIHEDVSPYTIKIPITYYCPYEELVKKTFTAEVLNDDNIDQFSDTAILCPKNEDCFKINELIVDTMLQGESKTYHSVDSITLEDTRDEQLYPTEFLNSLNPSGLPPHRLVLKKNSIVILIRNLQSKTGLVNGTRLIVTTLNAYTIVARVVHTGRHVIIPRITLSPSDPTMPFNLTRKQFPIKLAFAITINKAQGQTLTNAGLYLPQPAFSHGQLYVAFSRVRSFRNLKVAIVDGPEQQVKNDSFLTSNVVYKEIL